MSEGRPTGWEGADRWFSPGAGGTGGGGGDGEPPAPPDTAPDEPPPTPTCEVCGAPLDADQTYCLECGSPTPLAPRLHRGGRTAAILALAMIVLGLGAGALAFAVVQDDGDSSTGTVGIPVTSGAATVPLPPETAPTVGTLPADTTLTVPTAPTTPTGTSPGGTTGFDTVTGPSSAPATTGAPTTTATPPPATTSTPPPSGASDWPSGRTAWTAVLASVRNEADARAAKSRVASQGDPAGVLLSTDFADLRPGYWVVFSGTYDSQDPAIAQAEKLRPEFPTAYARQIEG